MAKLKAILIGFGKIGSGYASDPLMARYFPYASHAQVLRDHPAFDWLAVIDPSSEARAAALRDWGIPIAVADISDLPATIAPDIVVLASPPESRTDNLKRFPSAKLAIVEKPLGRTAETSSRFIDSCHNLGIAVQVNLFRRAEETTRYLANGGMLERIGRPQAVFSVYGNGMRNNAVHMVDLFRMLCGEVTTAQALSAPRPLADGPIPGDIALAFALTTAEGTCCTFMPLDFAHYREVGMDIWGEQGRLEILQEGLLNRISPRQPHRALQNAMEIANDRHDLLPSRYGHALYNIYDNAVAFLEHQTPLASPGKSALVNEIILDAVTESAANGGILIRLDSN
ncbi:Gfo/Idh/MocA family oxidoreductase [Ferrovibrio sp.]|uniref:Gfo/Idh/MocA family protein n=1 Tax=Ferrovibrio sp. TaxID=1917215 RepID=UPI0026340F4B|nr:Gfo/Idh/MocA family oxidoreductase [Ferrovibrio sp.]